MLQNQTIRTMTQDTRNPTPSTRPATTTRRGPTEDEIRLRAFQIYERRNREPGHEKDDWAQAERELRSQG